MFDFTVVALPGAFAAGVAATVNLLSAAAGLAPASQAPVPRWRVCSLDGGAISLQSGMEIMTSRLPVHSRSDASTWIVPGLALNTEQDVRHGIERPDCQRLARAISAHVHRGGQVAACCSAVFLLQLAGVLNGRRATTSWWLASLLQRLSPGCRVEADRMVCSDGPIVTGGAAFAQTDLTLHLLRQRCGTKLTETLSRFLLVDARDAQARYVIPEVLASGDELVSRIVQRIESSLPEAPAVASLAKELCVSERTLSRHVRRVTGKSTIVLVQSVKLRKARALLEQSRMSVEQVAAAVGYSDPTALRRLIRKVNGTSPSRFRLASTVA
jgi:transcriptional regulator GlxA family with amidase domain